MHPTYAKALLRDPARGVHAPEAVEQVQGVAELLTPGAVAAGPLEGPELLVADVLGHGLELELDLAAVALLDFVLGTGAWKRHRSRGVGVPSHSARGGVGFHGWVLVWIRARNAGWVILS